MVKKMKMATAKTKLDPHTIRVTPRPCMHARILDPKRKPMRPLIRLARIYRAAKEGDSIPALKGAKLVNGKMLVDLLENLITKEEGRTCTRHSERITASKAVLLKKTIEEINLLLADKRTSLEDVSEASEAKAIRECLERILPTLKDAHSLESYLEWMHGPSPPANYPQTTHQVPEALIKMGQGVSGAAVIGHGI